MRIVLSLAVVAMLAACAGPDRPEPTRTVAADPSGACLLYYVNECIAYKRPEMTARSVRWIQPEWQQIPGRDLPDRLTP